jgi:hypothetical protein
MSYWQLDVFEVAEFTTLTPLPSIIQIKLPFHILGLQISLLPTLVLKSYNQIWMWSLEYCLYNCSSSSQKLSCVSSVFSSTGAITFKTITPHQRPLSIIYDILSLTSSTIWIVDKIPLYTKNPVLIHDSHLHFHRKMCNCLLVQCHLFYLTSSTPANSNTHTADSLATAVNEPLLQGLFTFPCITSHVHFLLFRSYQRLCSRDPV